MVKQKGQNQYQQAFMTATEVLPVTDVRLPIHIVPETYVIHLTPFIIQGNYTIEGTFKKINFLNFHFTLGFDEIMDLEI